MVGWAQIPPEQEESKKRHFGVGQESLGPRGFVSINNSQCYCRGRVGACGGRERGSGRASVWAKESDVLQGWSRLWRPGRGADVFQWPVRDGETSRRQRQRNRRLADSTGNTERFGRAAVVGTGAGGAFTWWNRRRVDERGSRAEQEAVEQGGSAEDKRLQIEDKAHDLEGLRPGQGRRPLARMGLDRWKRCDWSGRLCVC